MNMEKMPGDEDMELPFHFSKKKVSAEEQQNNWNGIENTISSSVRVATWWKKSLLIAAGFAVLAFCIYFFKGAFETKAVNTYQTGYAQTKSLTLPDGSKVTLNANSTLRITAVWNEVSQREVWLDGEAYFEVEKKPVTKQKFLVHAKELDIEVLGTRFNVNTRHQKATVSLEEGKIKLSVNGVVKSISTKDGGKTVVEMKPGEIVRVDTINGVSHFASAGVNKKSGWVRNEWHFDSTSLREITGMISDVYGYKTEVKQDSLLDIRITGKLRAANINELLLVLKFTSGLDMTVKKKTIYISLP